MAPEAKRQKVDCFQPQVQSTQHALMHLATRGTIATTGGAGILLEKSGIATARVRAGEAEDVLAMGAACSECFSGPRLAKILKPAVDHQNSALEALSNGSGIDPLSIHTSVGVPASLGPFVDVLSKHFPWPETYDDWFINLQIEGTTAVWAGVEALMRYREVTNVARPHVGVAEASYHGPKTTGLGQPAQPRWPGAPRTQGQISYPRPEPGEETDATVEVFMKRFDVFLDEHGGKLGVIIFEPQWGSSNAGRPWPRRSLQAAVKASRERGILILCDEIMCGLGRHGQGTLFLSQALELEPDAVTFGKAIGGGVFPLSGIVMKQGAKALNDAAASMSQSHTYAASSSLALLTACEVVKELPAWFDHAAQMGEVVQEILGPYGDGRFMRVEGMGLMWGGAFVDPDVSRRQQALKYFREACIAEKVWPYFIPVGGFMISPPMDVDESQFRDGLQRLARCCAKVKQHMKC